MPVHYQSSGVAEPVAMTVLAYVRTGWKAGATEKILTEPLAKLAKTFI